MARTALVCGFLLVATLSWLNAGVTEGKSGTVETISTDNRTITVKFAHADTPTELKVPPEVVVRMDGAASELGALKPGMSVTVQVGSEGEADRILASFAKS